jgi:TonB family protein
MRACALLVAVAVAIAASSPAFASGRQNATPDLTLGEVILLANSADPGAPVALRGALASPDPVVRTAAGRVIAVVPHRELRPALIGALAREQDRAAGAEFVRDILHLSNGADLAFVEPQAKRLGQDAVLALAAWLARMQPVQFGDRLAALTPLTESAGHQLSALVSVAALQHPQHAQAIRRQWMAVAPAGTKDVLAPAAGPDSLGTPVRSATRTLTPFAPSAIGATFTAAQCVPNADGIAEASLTYAADGAPQRIEVVSAGLSKPCLAAWTALVRTAVAADEDPVMPDQPQAIVLPLNETFLSCVASDTRAARSTPLPADGGRIQEPRKLKDVKPAYPAAAQSRRIQGVIVVEAVISPTGCVSSARVLRSIPLLDSPAVAAVSGWLFTPTLLGGSPVPVIMTVTVNFTLQ